MRIAFSGSHQVGKTTLIADVHRELSGYRVVAEPYYELLDEGHIFSDPPSVEDFLEQLERSIDTLLSDTAQDVLFERSPADFLAYLDAHGAGDALRDSIASAGDALGSLDLIVFVPIEEPDRIATVGRSRMRYRVDSLLREMLVEDGYGFGRPVLTVEGTPQDRTDQVLANVRKWGTDPGPGAVPGDVMT